MGALRARDPVHGFRRRDGIRRAFQTVMRGGRARRSRSFGQDRLAAGRRRAGRGECRRPRRLKISIPMADGAES
jgi:hypothetical protein